MKQVLILFLLAGLCRAAMPKIGDPAPPLTFQELLQAPPGTEVTWGNLKGYAVILEFWATWCGGCREQISHLNRLHEQCRTKPVHFISLTDEETGVVQRFLKDYPISGWIGLDSGEQTFHRYDINGRPTTILVDRKGVVRGVGNASDLTGEIVEKLIDGEPITFSMDEMFASKLQSMPDPLYQVMVRPAAPPAVTRFSPGAISGKAGKRWETWGVWLQRLFSEAYNIPETRIVGPKLLTSERYDVALAAPDLTSTRRVDLLRRILQDTFEAKVHQEARDTDVYVLQRVPGMKTKLRASTSTGSSRWGKAGDIAAMDVPIGSLTSVVAQMLGKTVIDETGLTGRFDFELKWDAGEPQSVVEAIRTQLGLQLTPARRPLDYLIVDSVVQPAAW